MRVLPVLVVLLLTGCGGPSPEDQVAAYCAYGAKSEAQWVQCVEHVTITDLETVDSQAAHCAREGGGQCDGHGPYWDTWVELHSYCMDAEPNAPGVCPRD